MACHGKSETADSGADGVSPHICILRAGVSMPLVATEMGQRYPKLIDVLDMVDVARDQLCQGADPAAIGVTLDSVAAELGNYVAVLRLSRMIERNGLTPRVYRAVREHWNGLAVLEIEDDIEDDAA